VEVFFIVFGTLSFFLRALWRGKKTAAGYTLMKKLAFISITPL